MIQYLTSQYMVTTTFRRDPHNWTSKLALKWWRHHCNIIMDCSFYWEWEIIVSILKNYIFSKNICKFLRKFLDWAYFSQNHTWLFINKWCWYVLRSCHQIHTRINSTTWHTKWKSVLKVQAPDMNSCWGHDDENL
jgi:hypothetical protein